MREEISAHRIRLEHSPADFLQVTLTSAHTLKHEIVTLSVCLLILISHYLAKFIINAAHISKNSIILRASDLKSNK